MNDMLAIADIILAIAIIFVWTTLIVFIFIASILEKIYRRRFFSAVRAVLKVKKFDLDKCTDSVRNSYSVYRTHRYGFSSKKIIPICQELAIDLRNGKGIESSERLHKDMWADKLDEIIKQLQYEEAFDDEKANEIVDELKGNISNDIIEKVRRKLVFLEAYHKGVISVKDVEIQELKDKASRDTWFKWITGVLGIIGSVASIISLFIR